MSNIQLILLGSTVFLSLFLALQLKKRILDIFLLFLMVATAAVFILWPGITSTIARKLGVGRGADLIFYLSILLFWFVILKLFSRIRRIEQKMTEIIRMDALRYAKDPSETKSKTTD
jgi:small membrane protein